MSDGRVGTRLTRIIVGYDGSDRAEDGLALALTLAGGRGASILLAHVVGSGLPMAPDWQQYENVLREGAEQMLASAALSAGGDLKTRVTTSSSPAGGLHDIAESEDADLIVLGSSHRSALGRVLIGSVPERLLHGAPCAVAVAPRGFHERPERALRVVAVGVDGLPESKRALEFARRLAMDFGATLVVLAVVEPDIIFGSGAGAVVDRGELREWQMKSLNREVARAVEESPAALKAQGDVLSGRAAKALAERAQQGIDLLVLGSRAYGPVRRVLLGSVSAQLTRDAPCPLLIVPRSADGGEAAEESAIGSVGAT
jgi:nucleotide-binding universal stress UspA family protein